MPDLLVFLSILTFDRSSNSRICIFVPCYLIASRPSPPKLFLRHLRQQTAHPSVGVVDRWPSAIAAQDTCCNWISGEATNSSSASFQDLSLWAFAFRPPRSLQIP